MDRDRRRRRKVQLELNGFRFSIGPGGRVVDRPASESEAASAGPHVAATVTVQYGGTTVVPQARAGFKRSSSTC